MIETPKYLLVKGNKELHIIKDPVALLKDPDYNEVTDTLYQIGSEVKLVVKLEYKSPTRG